MKYLPVTYSAEEWPSAFKHIPGERLRNFEGDDPSLDKDLMEVVHGRELHDRDTFVLVASPTVECGDCGQLYQGSLLLDELRRSRVAGIGVPCPGCGEDRHWRAGRPEDDFPYVGGIMSVARTAQCSSWLAENRNRVAMLGFHVFDSPMGTALWAAGDEPERWGQLYRMWRSRHTPGA